MLVFDFYRVVSHDTHSFQKSAEIFCLAFFSGMVISSLVCQFFFYVIAVGTLVSIERIVLFGFSGVSSSCHSVHHYRSNTSLVNPHLTSVVVMHWFYQMMFLFLIQGIPSDKY